MPRPIRFAPSFAVSPPAHASPPAALAQRLLAHLGDRRYVRAVTFSPAPPATGSRVHVLYAGGHPPSDALQAHVLVRDQVPASDRHPSPAESVDGQIAQWEGELVAGALRDDLCAAGGAPLVIWSVAGGGGGFSDHTFALEQRFPNPSPTAFRKRVALVGRRYGFRVLSLRLLRPRQLAPLLVVETSRDRTAFVHDVPAIMALLDPDSSADSQTATTFEGFLFEARDGRGPFVSVESVERGTAEGGQWSANPSVFPYAHG